MKPNTITETLICSASAIFSCPSVHAKSKALAFRSVMNQSLWLLLNQNEKADRPYMLRLMVTVPNIAVATISHAEYILTFQESATSTWLEIVGGSPHHFRYTCEYNSMTMRVSKWIRIDRTLNLKTARRGIFLVS